MMGAGSTSALAIRDAFVCSCSNLEKKICLRSGGLLGAGEKKPLMSKGLAFL